MKLSRKDYLWITGLVVAVILCGNIFFQMNLRVNRSGEISLSEEPRVEEVKKTAIVSPGVFPAEERKTLSANLDLLGTVMGRKATAFIFDPRAGSGGLYRANDLIEGFRIAGILPGKVILEKDGERSELFLVSRPVRAAEDKESIVSRDESGTMIISKFQMVGAMFKANDLLSKIKIMPLADAAPNKLKGFRVDNVPPGSIIEDAGIKTGDVIYSVQGQRLQSMQDALAMFNRIQNQSRIEVVLMRNDQPVTLKYEIRN